MELLITLVSVQLLWVELERMVMFVSIRNERLEEEKMIPAQDESVINSEGSNMSFIEENREKKGILERVLFACSDWFSDLSKSAEQNKQRTKSIEDAIRAVSVTIDKMNEDYHANKISAQKKYGGKFLKVSGIIIDIGYGSMGLMYYRGWGVTRDYDTALEWYNKAAAQGSEVAKRRINSIQLLKINKAKIASIERGTGFPVSGTIFAETLSVRQSPDTNSRRFKTLKTGHPVSISRAVESDNDYWFYIKTASGTEGWVLGGYVKLVDRDLTYEESRNRRCSLPKSGHIRTSSQGNFLNLRNIPAVKGSEVVEKLDNGESFTAYEVFAGDTVDWYRIRTSFTGNEGWVSGKYIELDY